MFRFVHFTAKEHIFGQQSNFFLKEWDAHRNIASVCMCYLSFDCFDIGFPEETVRSTILYGDYALQTYAESVWLGHIKICARTRDESIKFKEFCEEINTFVEARSNPDFEEPSDKRNSPACFDAFKDWSDMHGKLSLGSYFISKRRKLSTGDGDDWENLDPFTISISSLHIRRLFGSLLCPSRPHRSGCHCSILATHYGTRLYKCERLGCKFYWIGFETPAERKSRMLAHDRPFKCDIGACDFAEIGFTSELALIQHMSDCHTPGPKQSANDSRSAGLDIQGFELAVITDAVEAGEVNCVRDLLWKIPSDSLPDLISKVEGSVEIMELLLKRACAMQGLSPRLGIFLMHPLEKAVKTENSELVKTILCCRKESVSYKALNNALAIGSPSMIRILLSANPSLGDSLPKFQALLDYGKRLNNESIIIECLQVFIELASNLIRYIDDILRRVVDSGSSVRVAKFLIERGARVDDKGTGRYTVLHKAARQTTAAAAEMVKFLLLQGADPDVRRAGKLPRDLPGAQNISRWLGVTWDELVESTRCERLTQLQRINDGSPVLRQSNIEGQF